MNVDVRAFIFSTFDVAHGYWQVPLEEASQDLTTFMTPWGRYKFLRGTMGLISAGDEFCRRVDAALTGMPNMIKVVDDMCMYGTDMDAHFRHVLTLLLAYR